MKRLKLSMGEEIANAITHGVGATLSLVALVLLISTATKNGDAGDITGAIIFGVSMFFLYMMSTLCHSFALKEGTTTKIFRILDHSAIYLLIAGTYTPFCLSIIGGTKGYVILAIQWSLAIIGIIFRTVFYDKYTIFHIGIYLAMGWMVIFFMDTLSQAVSQAGMTFLIAGGLFYSIGIIFYAIRLFKYHHMVWHICVLAGTTCHFFMIYYYVLPR